jgi:multidrug efflux pump subunit AcrA (membrane-fusion protein)
MNFMKYILLLLLALGLFACKAKKSGEDEEQTSNVQPVVSVKVADITRGEIAITIAATGKTDAVRKEKIYAPIAGKLISFNMLDGQAVYEGDVIAIIRTKESQAAISGAEALLQAAKTDEQKIDARKNLDLAIASQTKLEIKARFNGIVANRIVTQGEIVGENAELATIIDLSTVYFFASVPLRDLSSLHQGERCYIRFQSLPEGELTGEIDAISPQSDLQSQTVVARIGFTALPAALRKNIKIDMMGTVRIVTGIHHNVLLAPKTALIRNDELNTYSIIAVADSIAHILPVTVGVFTDSTAEIISGELKEGMKVVIEGASTLPDSTHVRIVSGKE